MKPTLSLVKIPPRQTMLLRAALLTALAAADHAVAQGLQPGESRPSLHFVLIWDDVRPGSTRLGVAPNLFQPRPEGAPPALPTIVDLSFAAQQRPDHHGEHQSRAKHERQADRPREELRRIAAPEDHRAPQVLLEKRP